MRLYSLRMYMYGIESQWFFSPLFFSYSLIHNYSPSLSYGFRTDSHKTTSIYFWSHLVIEISLENREHRKNNIAFDCILIDMVAYAFSIPSNTPNTWWNLSILLLLMMLLFVMMLYDCVSVLIWVYRPYFLIGVQFHFHLSIHQKKVLNVYA